MEKLVTYLSYPFVQYALIAGTFIALCSALMGVILVLKHFSFIGDCLSHVAFGAMSVATVMKLTESMALVLPVTIACAVVLLYIAKNNSDAYLAAVSVTTLAFGYTAMNLFPAKGNVSGDVCSTLFGSTSILTLKISDVYICLLLSGVVIALFIVFYKQIFSMTFDEDFCRATGEKVNIYNMVLAIVIATVIVLAMNLVGSLLITALIVFPALGAMKLAGSFKKVCLIASAISVVCAFAGMLVSILAGTPVGSTIVIIDTICFIVCLIFGKR